MKILVDMNISPSLCSALDAAGWESIHWSEVGEQSAPDGEILAYASSHGYVVLTHDLDFGAILAATRAKSPSVIQLRIQDVLSDHYRDLLLRNLKKFESDLDAGAVVVVEETKSRARILPIVRD